MTSDDSCLALSYQGKAKYWWGIDKWCFEISVLVLYLFLIFTKFTIVVSCKVYLILDEFILAGELQETSKRVRS